MGELAALASSVCWAVASLLFAKLGEGLGPLAMNLAKCVVAFALLSLTLLALEGTPWPLDFAAEDLGWLVASGLVGLTLGDTLYFAALVRLGPRRTLILSALTPPMTALMAYPALGEALSFAMIAGMAVTLGGVAWVIRERSAPPKGGATTGTSDESARAGHALDVLGILLGTGAAACQAGANVLVKLGGEGHDSLPIAVVRLAAGAAGLVLVVAVRQRLHESARVFSTARVAGLLLIATFIGTYLGIWLQVAGLTGAKAGVAATLSSTAPIFVLPLAAVFLGERPSGRAVAGALVAVLGIAILFLF